MEAQYLGRQHWQQNQALVLLEMRGLIFASEETLPIDDWLVYVQDTLRRLVEVPVPRESLGHVLSAIVPMSLDPTRANAISILRSHGCCSKLVGSTLATQASRLLLAEVAEVPVPLLSPDAVVLGLKRDLLSTLALQHGPRQRDLPDCITPVKKARRDPTSVREMKEAKTRQCLWILENRLAVTRAGQALLSARDLIAHLEGEGSRDPWHTDMAEVLLCRQALGRHLLLLDGAVDRRASDLLF